MGRKALGPSPLREAATFPPQADHVLVVFFFIHGGPGGCVKAPRQSNSWTTAGGPTIQFDFDTMYLETASQVWTLIF